MSDFTKAFLLRPLEGFTVGREYPIKHITDSMNRKNFLEYLVNDNGRKKFFGFTKPLDKADREMNKHFELIEGNS